MGKHAKKTDHKRTIATAAVVAAGGVAVPLASTPANAATVGDWDRIAQCESTGQWNLPFGDFGKSSGGLQFQPASWGDALAYLRSKGVDTSAYPQGFGHQAYKATKQQQIIAGEALLALQGPGAWTCNAKTGYPLQSSGPHGSMFKGGMNPYPAVSEAPPPVTPPVTRPAVPTPKPKPPVVSSPSHSHYKVVKGDWLIKIAKRLGVDGGWQAIYNANKIRIKDADLIFPGQVLNIPMKTRPAAPDRPVAPPPKAPQSATKVFPVEGVDSTTNPYGAPRSGYSLGYHTGVDFTAPTGTPVRAAAAGTVVAADTAGAYGINVQIRHADGTYTLYAHLSTRLVTPGQAVGAGQLIGRVGSTGNSSGPHLHFEVRKVPQFGAGNFLNPLVWLKG